MTSRASILRRVAAFGVGERLHLSPEPEVWARLFHNLLGERLTGLAAAMVTQGFLELDDQQINLLTKFHRDSMAHALKIEQELLRADTALKEAGVDFVVLKGVALAHTLYDDPSMRPYGDVDLLVHTLDWRRACGALDAIGYRRCTPEPRRGFDERFGKAARHLGPRGHEIDLHRTLVVGPFGLWIDSEELLGRRITFRLGGRTLHRLDDSAMFINQCVHAALGQQSPRLMSIRDVAQVAVEGNVDWDLVDRWRRRWHLTAVVRHALRLARDDLGCILPDEALVLCEGGAPRDEARTLSAYTTNRRLRGGVSMTTLRAIDGVGRKAAYINALLLPKDDFLAVRAQSGGSGSHAGRLSVPLRWLIDGQHLPRFTRRSEER